MASEVSGEEASLVDHARVIWRYRWVVFSLCLVALAAAFLITIRTPRIYEATVTLIVPREGVGSGILGGLAVSGLLQQVPGISVPSLTPNRDLLISLLKSRTVAEMLVDRFGLQKRYDVRFREDAIKALQDATNISVSKEGVIAIRVEDIEPGLAAEMANFYVERVDRLVAQYGTGEAGRQRAFLSSQLALAKTQLDSAEESLRSFQERNRAIVLQEQTRGAIEAAGRLKGEIIAAEVQLQVTRNFATEANPEVSALRRRIEEMKHQLAQMQYGDGVLRPSGRNRERSDFSVPFSRVPEVGLELARLTRDAKIQETLVSIITQQLAQSRMMEARDMPVVQVLDRAVPAEQHSRPRLRVNLAIAGMGGGVAGVVLAFILEFAGNLRQRRRGA